MHKVSAEKVKRAGELLKKEHEQRVAFEKKAHDLEKIAQDFQDFQKATKLVFLCIENGLSEPLTGFDDFMQKVAHVQSQDMNMLQKAIELGSYSLSLSGELIDDENHSLSKTPTGYELFDNFINLGRGPK